MTLQNKLKPRFYYILILSLVGFALIFIIPPFQTPDEQTHLYRAYQLSEGHLIADHLSYGAGGTLPTSLSDAFNKYSYLIFKPDNKVTLKYIRSTITAPLNSTVRKETRFENTAPYPPLGYLPQVIGISIGRIISANPVILLYMARISNLLVWILGIWLCMKRQPKLSLALFSFSLIPIVLYQASSASADVMASISAVFLTLEVFRITQSDTLITKKERLVVLCVGVILSLCKFPYVLLVLLVLLIQNDKFKSKKSALIFKLLAVLLPLSITSAWLVVSMSSFVNLQPGVNTALQLHYILTEPINYIKVLFNTYATTNSDGLYIQMFGQLGWLDTKLPFWSIIFSGLSVTIATISISIKPNRIKSFAKLGAIFVMISTILAITSLLYLTWNTPRSNIVEGLQGRYFIPFIGIIIFIIGGQLALSRQQSKKASLLVYSLSGLTLISTISIILLRYYHV
ncbi:MAG: DUF2142 domain-containing protein [Candidatus Saccharibacteria bacterium]